jgi:hypothetical protein
VATPESRFQSDLNMQRRWNCNENNVWIGAPRSLKGFHTLDSEFAYCIVAAISSDIKGKDVARVQREQVLDVPLADGPAANDKKPPSPTRKHIMHLTAADSLP